MQATSTPVITVPWLEFQLDEDFFQHYMTRAAPFGGNGLGEATFLRTYSRDDNPRLPELPNQEGVIPEHRRHYMESWAFVCRRVIEGTYTIELQYCRDNGINYNLEKAQRAAQEAFALLFDMKWMPPGRGLQHMGSRFIHERGVVEAIQNCGFVTTGNMDVVGAEPFRWLMEMSMLGVGVGFDTRGSGKALIIKPVGTPRTWAIPDSREGWADSVYAHINSYLHKGTSPLVFDYSMIRAAGEPIRGFGGKAGGPEALEKLHEQIDTLVGEQVGKKISTKLITDLMNVIGVCVVSGNVRRSAEIALGDADDTEFLHLKDYRNGNGYRAAWGWMSNNSVMVEPRHDAAYYLPMAEQTWVNGEPGYFWIDNARKYERMNKVIDERDEQIFGINPCGEQMLRTKELCTLTEIFASRITSNEEARLVVKHAYHYAKIVTIASDKIKDPESRDVMLKNRRIGLSMTGLATLYDRIGAQELAHWLSAMYNHVERYDALYSQWYKIPRSVRSTSVKPSGTISLLPLVTPGVHFSVTGRWHIRRVTFPENSRLAAELIARGYPAENSVYTPKTVVISFPVDMGEDVRSEKQVSPREQLELHALVNRNWSGNNTSQTIKFSKETTSAQDIAELLAEFDDKTKAISFLPDDGGTYKQMPYEEVTRERYEEMVSKIIPFHLEGLVEDMHEIDEKFCMTDACETIGFRQQANSL